MSIAILPGGGGFYPPPWSSSNAAPGFDNLAIAAAGAKYAAIHRVRRTGTLDKFEYRTGTVSVNAASSLRHSFQDPDLATGHPDTTADQFRDVAGSVFASNKWMGNADIGLITSDGTDTGTKRSVTRKDRICCVVHYQTFTAADSIQISGHQHGTSPSFGNYPWVDFDSGAGYAKQGGHYPNMALKYSDGTYEVFNSVLWPAKAISFASFNNTGANHQGNYFRFPYPVHVRGCWVWVDPDGDFDIKLYKESDGTVLDSVSVDKDELESQLDIKSFWPLDASLDANTNYVLMVVPTSATSVALYYADVATTALMDAVCGGAQWQYATATAEPTGPGDFTKTSTRHALVGLEVDGGEAGGAAASQMVRAVRKRTVFTYR